MATANIVAGILLITLCCFSGGGCKLVSAQQPPAPEPIADGPSSAADAPSPAVDCLRNMLNVSDCLSYVQVGSNETRPEGACCPELAGMVESSPECLCNLLGGGASARFGIKLDKNRALELPSICGVAAPSPSLCSVLGFPAVAPAGSEGSSSPGSQPSEGDNNNGGPTAGNSAGASVYAVVLASSVFMLFF